MITATWSLRRLHALDDAQIDALAGVLIDCVEGGASVSFMHPLSRVSDCNCSICRRKGYLHHMVSPDRFRLIQGEADIAAYQFGTMRALHHFCRHCGVAAFYRPRANPVNYMVNVRCLEGVDLDSLERVGFDGRRWELRPDAPYTGIWKSC